MRERKQLQRNSGKEIMGLTDNDEHRRRVGGLWDEMGHCTPLKLIQDFIDPTLADSMNAVPTENLLMNFDEQDR